MCFVLQIINFHSHDTSLKNKNDKAYSKSVLAQSHMCIFYNAAVSKNILSWTRYHSLHWGYQNVDDSNRYTGNFVIFWL